jgi:biotin transport system permease protein
MYNLGHYIPGESIIHRLDPRVKIVSVIGISIMVLNGDVFTLAIFSIFLGALIASSRIALHHIVKALRPVVVFFALIFLLHLIFTEGTPIQPFPSWRVTVTYEGLNQGALVTWRFILLVVAASVLTMTTSPTELVSGIERLIRPLNAVGIPSHDVALMISIALRFVPTFVQEVQRIKEAQMARGANFKTGNIVAKAKATSSLLLPLVVNSVRRADELASAMEARGYRRGPRTYLRDLRMSRADYAALAVVVIITGFHILQG